MSQTADHDPQMNIQKSFDPRSHPPTRTQIRPKSTSVRRSNPCIVIKQATDETLSRKDRSPVYQRPPKHTSCQTHHVVVGLLLGLLSLLLGGGGVTTSSGSWGGSTTGRSAGSAGWDGSELVGTLRDELGLVLFGVCVGCNGCVTIGRTSRRGNSYARPEEVGGRFWSFVVPRPL